MKKLILITLTCLATLAFLLLVWELRNVVAILLAAIVLATTISGFVQILVNRGWSNRSACFVIAIGTLIFIAALLLLTGYAFGERLPLALNDFRTMYGEMRAALLSGSRAQMAIAIRLPAPIRLDDLFFGTDGSGLLTIASGISSNFGQLASNLVLVIFVALYWVADRERIERLWLSLLSPNQRPTTRKLIYELEDAIGSFLRSQIVQYMLSLLLLITGYILLGLKYPLLLAWIAPLLWFVPLMGGFLALIPALLLGLINGYISAVGAVVYTIFIFVIVHLFIQRYPSLRQRPGSILGLMVTIALIDVIGLIGLAIAMPVTVAIHVVTSHYLSTAPAATVESPELHMQSMMEKLTLIQNRINEQEATIAPSTLNIFNRLSRMVASLDLKD